MAEKKMTKKDYFTTLYDLVNDCYIEGKIADDENADLKNFINHELDLLSRKNATRSQTPNQKENVSIMETITNVLSDSADALSVSELQKNAALSRYTNQRITALLHKLCAEGSVVRIMDKRKAYYKLAD